MQEGDALGSMYEKDGLLATEDGNIFMWAGATVGGGTRVNWWLSSLSAHMLCPVPFRGLNIPMLSPTYQKDIDKNRDKPHPSILMTLRSDDALDALHMWSLFVKCSQSYQAAQTLRMVFYMCCDSTYCDLIYRISQRLRICWHWCSQAVTGCGCQVFMWILMAAFSFLKCRSVAVSECVNQ